jgi:hypothetical protein
VFLPPGLGQIPFSEGLASMKSKILLLASVAAAIALTQPLTAISTTANVTVSATVSATAKLALTSATVSFPNADPDTTPSIPASEGAITVTAKAKTSSSATVTLTLLAADDLKSGLDTIAISNITWTAGGAGFVAGTMNRITAQTVASWTNSGSRTGTQSYALANSWNYATGSYSATATYTLTAP